VVLWRGFGFEQAAIVHLLHCLPSAFLDPTDHANKLSVDLTLILQTTRTLCRQHDNAILRTPPFHSIHSSTVTLLQYRHMLGCTTITETQIERDTLYKNKTRAVRIVENEIKGGGSMTQPILALPLG
jgi:uncharacterized protein YceK